MQSAGRFHPPNGRIGWDDSCARQRFEEAIQSSQFADDFGDEMLKEGEECNARSLEMRNHQKDDPNRTRRFPEEIALCEDFARQPHGDLNGCQFNLPTTNNKIDLCDSKGFQQCCFHNEHHRGNDGNPSFHEMFSGALTSKTGTMHLFATTVSIRPLAAFSLWCFLWVRGLLVVGLTVTLFITC